MNRTESHSVCVRPGVMPGEEPGGRARQPVTNRNGLGPRSVIVVLSILGSAAAMAAVGCVCAFIYPILKELRAARVTAEDGTEQRMMGFWTILVLSVLVGYICFVFSWTLTYLDSYHSGEMSGTPPTQASFRDVSSYGGVAVLNGIMGMLTVIWSLT